MHSYGVGEASARPACAGFYKPAIFKASIGVLVLSATSITTAWGQGKSNDYIAPAEAAQSIVNEGEPAPAAAAAPASASTPAVNLKQITVTGSAVPHAATANALPVTSYSADAMRAQGITSISGALNEVAANDTSSGPGAGYGLSITGGGRFANLRGLGPEYTLVLLNGRRVANQAFSGGSASLNGVPFSAIDRIEVLQTGASALYGTDAVAGVINFITKKNYQGSDFKLTYTTPTRDGGGNSRLLTGTFGFGDIDEDRFNVTGSFTYRRQDPITAASRQDITYPYRPDEGVDGTSLFTFPPNYYQGDEFGNPGVADGCPGQYSILIPGDTACYNNPTPFYQVQQDDDYASFFGQGAYKISDNHQVRAEFYYTHSTINSQIGPYGLYGTIQPGTRYYPGNGVVPNNNPNIDPTQPVRVAYRNTITGPRSTENTNQQMRGLLDFSGRFGEIHYDTAFQWNQQTTTLTYTGGYLDARQVEDPVDNPFSDAINTGLINPFSRNFTPYQTDLFNNLLVTGQAEKDRSHEYVWDGKLNRSLGDWFGGGQVAAAVGSQVRYTKLDTYSNGDVLNGIDGGGLSVQNIHNDRTVESVWADVNFPILATLELEAKGRYDHYSDFGSTSNPQVSLRWQPIEQFVLRGNYSEGFKAPNLYNLYTGQSITYTSNGLSDPVLCPDGENAVSGYTTRAVCNTQFERHYGGNEDLDPTTSRQYGFGFVVEPVQNLTTSLDYYHIRLEGESSLLPVNLVFDNLDQYGDLIHRIQEGDRAGEIDYIQTDYANLGATTTEGLDAKLNYILKTAGFGVFSLDFRGTYILNYDYQNSPDQPFVSNEGVFSDYSPVPQWKHTITLSWHKAGFNASFKNHFTSGYRDAQPSYHHDVDDYITYDASVGYKFHSGLSLQIGSNNIFDTDPPFSNQNSLGITGYDPRYASAVGRTVFGTVGYEF
ncbi:TonB-dependent receptor [Salinisphaera sp. SPP-AMP-43]|uniref:TonB-dependent receptor n=1 Tax=Salinisphaera sp. SPP-AMP-43 TaxID=3121288 RepID=UPI003C6DF7B4